MAQHDYNIANDFFPQTRADINNALSGIASKCSGATDPASAGNATTGGNTQSYQWWVDTGTSTLKMRNSANSEWTILASLNSSGYNDLYSENMTINGDATVGGDLTVNGTLIESSSKYLKKNIIPIKNQLSKLLKLQGVEYDRKSTGNHEIGLIAEDVREVFPILVDENIKGIQYSKLTAILVESIKELKGLVDNQNTKIQELESRLGV